MKEEVTTNSWEEFGADTSIGTFPLMRTTSANELIDELPAWGAQPGTDPPMMRG
jgi:hypothetical protein